MVAHASIVVQAVMVLLLILSLWSWWQIFLKMFALRRVRDFAEVRAAGNISCEVADLALQMLDVDAMGLDVMDRKLLHCVLDKFGGGPVGVDNLAAAIGEERDTIEDVLEPFLIQQGFLQRTNRGRIATALSYRHLGVTPPKATGGLFAEP